MPENELSPIEILRAEALVSADIVPTSPEYGLGTDGVRTRNLDLALTDRLAGISADMSRLVASLDALVAAVRQQARDG